MSENQENKYHALTLFSSFDLSGFFSAMANKNSEIKTVLLLLKYKFCVFERTHEVPSTIVSLDSGISPVYIRVWNL